MDQYIGKMLDNRYEILERIGTGGMAVVYKAKCHRLNRLVAMKILKSDLAQDEDFRRRFNAESQAVAQLSHPNIVSVYDVSKGGDTEYIVMELIDGITLKQYMEKRGQLNWRETLHFITQIMRGLSHAHSRGIVHRDIKPQNIMVLRDGSVKVADFGIACLENSAQTLTQEALGSVHYISPEQARGERTDARSDIYSAGVVLYEMLTGRLPFVGDSAVSVAIQHLSSIPLAPREINPEIPQQLELICLKAMAPDIQRRYASADEMIADLESFRKNPGVSLDFELKDLRPEEVDEPTMKLKHAAVHTGEGRRAPAARERRQPVYEDDEDDYLPDSGGRGRVVLVVIACLLAIALAGVMIRNILDSFNSPAVPDQYLTPRVLSYTLEEAQSLSDVNGVFKIEVKDEIIYTADYPIGTIAKQAPAEGEPQKGENLTITVWLSGGEETGVMPLLKDRSMAEVTVLMKELKEKYDLTIEAPEEDMQYSEEVTAGYVISTDPADGAVLKKGDVIHIVLSKGPQPTQLISFVNQDLTWAQEQMTIMKLTLEISYEYNAEVAAGKIIRQEPAAGTDVVPGDTVKFFVSEGPEPGTGELYTYGLTIPLPSDAAGTKRLQIYQGYECVFDQSIDCTPGSFFYELEGPQSEYLVTVYLDGEIIYNEIVNITNG